MNRHDPLYHISTGKDIFGVGENFKIGAKNIALEELSSKFTVYDGEKEEEFSLDMPGEHNISNLMLGIAIAKELGVSFEEMKRRML